MKRAAVIAMMLARLHFSGVWASARTVLERAPTRFVTGLYLP